MERVHGVSFLDHKVFLKHRHSHLYESKVVTEFLGFGALEGTAASLGHDGSGRVDSERLAMTAVQSAGPDMDVISWKRSYSENRTVVLCEMFQEEMKT